MKKLLILLMLIIENIVFGVNTELTGNQEAVVNVEAEILAPLKLEIEDMDFGGVMQGQQNKKAKTPGKLNITGEPNREIKISMKGINETDYVEKKEYETFLVKEGTLNVNEDQKMKAILKISNTNVLKADGTLSVEVDGNITAKTSQESGIYNGKMFVRVEYK